MQHGADGALAARQAAVRNGDAIAEAGGTEFFPGHQVFEDGLGVELRQLPGYQVGDLFEYAFLLPPGTFTRERPGSGFAQVGS